MPVKSSGSLTKLGLYGGARINYGSFTGKAAVTEFFQTITGSITGGGLVSKRTSKSFEGSITSSGVTTSASVFLSSLVGSITTSGSLVKTTFKALAGSITGSATLIKTTYRLLTGSMTLSGSISKLTNKIFSGSITIIGVLVSTLTVSQSIAGSITTSGTVVGTIVAAAAGIVRRIRHGIQLILGNHTGRK